MPQKSISICEKCGESFIIDLSECQILPGMRPTNRKQDSDPRPIRTWVDWIDHVSTHCRNCRYPQPPLQAVGDLERYQKRRNEN
jgi:hypothetical protein